MTIVSLYNGRPALAERQWSEIVDILERAIAGEDVASTGELASRILDAIDDLAAEEEFSECNSEIDTKPRIRVPARSN